MGQSLIVEIGKVELSSFEPSSERGVSDRAIYFAVTSGGLFLSMPDQERKASNGFRVRKHLQTSGPIEPRCKAFLSRPNLRTLRVPRSYAQRKSVILSRFSHFESTAAVASETVILRLAPEHVHCTFIRTQSTSIIDASGCDSSSPTSSTSRQE